MLLLLLLASSSTPPPRGAAVVQASARGRIVRAEPASREWKEKGSAHKREILVREADGSLTRLRLVEHE
jgi:hypothetical protein